jgi:hypothetical protein
MGVDNIHIPLLKLTLCVFEIASYLTFDKQQHLHSLMPMGRNIGTEVVFVFYTEAGFFHIGQHTMLIVWHDLLLFPNF